MKELNIPESHYPLFKSFIKLPKEIKEQIAERFKEAELGLSPSSLVNFISSGVEHLSEESISGIVQVVFNLINSKERENVSLSDFLEILEVSLKNTGEVELIPNEEAMYYFELILSNSNNVRVTATIFNTITENGKVFLDAKFLQDIRPIFDSENNFIGGVIINNLKIIFKEDDEQKEIFIALDDKDLDNFSDAIKEARGKNKSIKTNFMGVKIIDII